MKTARIVVQTALLYLLLLGGHAQGAERWTLHQHPTGAVEVDGVTYIPSNPEREKMMVSSMRKGGVLKLGEKCTTRPDGLWQNTKVCRWEMELHDRGDRVEKGPGGVTEVTGPNARVFALLGAVFMTICAFSVFGGNAPVPGTMSVWQSVKFTILVVLPLLCNFLTLMPILPGNPEPWLGTPAWVTAMLAFCLYFANFFVYITNETKASRLRMNRVLALGYVACMVLIVFIA